MALEITRPGKLIDPVNNKVSRFVAVNPNECIYAFHRKDYEYKRIDTDSGYATIVVTGNITTFLNVGDGVYFTSRKYEDNSTTIKSYQYVSGTNETEIQTELTYAGAIEDNTAGFYYLNLTDGLGDYKVKMTIYHGVSHSKIVNVPARRPFIDGRLNFDVAPFLRAEMRLSPSIAYGGIHSPNSNNSLPFYIRYLPEIDGVNQTIVNDYPNVFTAVGAAQQIGAKYGSNLGEFVSFDYNLNADKRGLFMTEFEEPTYWEGYPFGLGFCYQNDGAISTLNRVQQVFDINDTQLSLTSPVMNLSSMHWPNHLGLSTPLIAGAEYVKVWLEGDFSVGYCGVLGFQTGFDYQSWTLDGSNNLLGILVDKDPALVASIDTRPDGILYDNTGTQQAVLEWSVANTRYEPASGTHNITVSGWYAVIPGIQVTLSSTYDDDTCNATFIQTFNIPAITQFGIGYGDIGGGFVIG